MSGALFWKNKTLSALWGIRGALSAKKNLIFQLGKLYLNNS
jgi:hypothetical protein